MIKTSLYRFLIDNLNKSLINDENVLKLAENPIRNRIINSLYIRELLSSFSDNARPRIIEAIELISTNLLLLFNLIEWNLVKNIYLKFAPNNDPTEIIERLINWEIFINIKTPYLITI